MKQEPPFCIQIELTEGCNLFCNFCGLRGIRERAGIDLKFMSLERATIIARSIARAVSIHGWNPRIEFAMHGEPTLNPELFDIIRAFRTALPKASLMITSNGAFSRESIEPVWFVNELRLAGLNILAIDCYEYARKIWELIKKNLTENGFLFGNYPGNNFSNPHRRSDPNVFRVVFVADISKASSGTHSSLNTHCGCGSSPKTVQKRCGKPFRELSIRWDGSVALCCNDWRGDYVIASDIREWGHLDDLWQNPRFNAARRHLYHGQRTFHPCDKCDALTYRPGLLPDQKGKESLGAPNDTDHCHIRVAQDLGPLTPHVKRQWEI